MLAVSCSMSGTSESRGITKGVIMGYAFVIGPCLVCKRPFSFNPVRVPSFRVEGKREPICEPCIKFINTKRKEKGMEPFTYADDAYEACREEELP